MASNAIDLMASPVGKVPVAIANPPATINPHPMKAMRVIAKHKVNGIRPNSGNATLGRLPQNGTINNKMKKPILPGIRNTSN